MALTLGTVSKALGSAETLLKKPAENRDLLRNHYSKLNSYRTQILASKQHFTDPNSEELQNLQEFETYLTKLETVLKTIRQTVPSVESSKYSRLGEATSYLILAGLALTCSSKVKNLAMSIMTSMTQGALSLPQALPKFDFISNITPEQSLTIGLTLAGGGLLASKIYDLSQKTEQPQN